MGFFSFLEPQQDESAPPKAKGYVPEGWKVRRQGEDFWRADETQAGEGDELQGPDNIPKATDEEMKPYSQRRGERSSRVFQAADQIIDRMAKDLPYLKQDAEETKRTIRAKPEDAAKALEKFYDVAQKSNPGTSFSGSPLLPQLYGQDFSDLENHVRSLRTMKRGAEEQTLTGKLGAVDLAKNVSELQNLKGQLDTLTKEIATAQDTMPEAVSRRGEQENKKALAYKQQQAAAIAEHIKQLETVTKPKGPMVDESNIPASELPVTAAPVTNFMKGLGVDKEDLSLRLHAALNKVGIPQHQWEDQNVDPSAGLMRVLSELDPENKFAGLIAQQMAIARQEDATAKGGGAGKAGAAGNEGGSVDLEHRIQGKEDRMRQLYAELRETPFMRTWPGLILYVLVGVLTQNPAFAARLIGGVGNRQAVDAEMKGLQFDIRRLDEQMRRREHDETYIKREAARRLTAKDDQADQRKWEMSKLMLNHKLIIDRNAKRGNPETFLMKKLSGDFQRNLGMASKFQGTMQNEFADPKDRAEAKQNWTIYMRRAAELDQQIQQLGGGASQQGEDSGE